MAGARPGQPTKPPHPSAPWRGKHGPNAYVAKVATLEEVWRFVQGGAGPDAAVAWVADRQLGLITAPQLHVAGVGRGSIEWRRATGTLHPRHRGVYLVGHPILLPGAAELAAVLACGARAFVSHRSAAALWGLVDAPTQAVELTVVGRNCRSHDRMRIQRVVRLAPSDRDERNGIPITSAARTAIDFAGIAGRDEVERAIAEAFSLRLVTRGEILAAAQRAPTRAGVAAVRAILGQEGGPRRTRSWAERTMLGLIRAARLPITRTNYPVAGFSADFCWPDQRLIVEVDGYDFHSQRAAFERDHRRDVVHKDAGFEVLRFTASQLENEPLYVATVIARALERRSRHRG